MMVSCNEIDYFQKVFRQIRISFVNVIPIPSAKKVTTKNTITMPNLPDVSITHIGRNLN